MAAACAWVGCCATAPAAQHSRTPKRTMGPTNRLSGVMQVLPWWCLISCQRRKNAPPPPKRPPAAAAPQRCCAPANEPVDPVPVADTRRRPSRGATLLALPAAGPLLRLRRLTPALRAAGGTGARTALRGLLPAGRTACWRMICCWRSCRWLSYRSMAGSPAASRHCSISTSRRRYAGRRCRRGRRRHRRLGLYRAPAVAVHATVSGALRPRGRLKLPAEPRALLPLAVLTVWLGPARVLEPHRAVSVRVLVGGPVRRYAGLEAG